MIIKKKEENSQHCKSIREVVQPKERLVGKHTEFFFIQ